VKQSEKNRVTLKNGVCVVFRAHLTYFQDSIGKPNRTDQGRIKAVRDEGGEEKVSVMVGEVAGVDLAGQNSGKLVWGRNGNRKLPQYPLFVLSFPVVLCFIKDECSFSFSSYLFEISSILPHTHYSTWKPPSQSR
jgi:hypothetical protein